MTETLTTTHLPNGWVKESRTAITIDNIICTPRWTLTDPKGDRRLPCFYTGNFDGSPEDFQKALENFCKAHPDGWPYESRIFSVRLFKKYVA